jgi:hypothetical protein
MIDAPRLSLIARKPVRKYRFLLCLSIGNICVMAQSYSKGALNMDLQNLNGVLPTRRNCYALLEQLESAYQVKLAFWLKMSKPVGGEVQTRVYVAGSGNLFDLRDGLADSLSTLVLESQGGNLYAALWSLLCQLDSELRQLVKGIDQPPIP